MLCRISLPRLSLAHFRLISSLHSLQSLGSYSPGPARYDRKEGKGIKNSMGDAPTWKFGTTERVPPGKGAESKDWVPGPGAYNPKVGGHGIALALLMASPNVVGAAWHAALMSWRWAAQ